MILLKKRRSQSESRKVEQSRKNAFDNRAEDRLLQQKQQQIIQSFAFGDTTATNSLERRKTSAEMISEAKSMLAEISSKASHSGSDGGNNNNSNRIGSKCERIN